MTIATPMMRQGGLPQSASAQTLQTMASPMSEVSMPQSKHSEPKNWAPGKTTFEGPPPKFSLPVTAPATTMHHSPSKSVSTVGSDPFYSDSNGGSCSSVQPLYHQQQHQQMHSEQLALVHVGGPNDIHLSTQLKFLISTPFGLPSFSIAMDPKNFPFMDSAKQHKSINYGVIKIRNVSGLVYRSWQTFLTDARLQIPFATKRTEIIAFLGRAAKILKDSDEPVHIIMERVTSKTMDAFVEFESLDDAMKAVERHRSATMGGRSTRLGDRPVEMEVASQGVLMKELFPITRGVFWDGVTPKFQAIKEKEPWENFRGFVSEEEMTLLIKHVEVPHRVSSFDRPC